MMVETSSGRFGMKLLLAKLLDRFVRLHVFTA